MWMRRVFELSFYSSNSSFIVSRKHLTLEMVGLG